MRSNFIIDPAFAQVSASLTLSVPMTFRLNEKQ